MNVFKAGFFVVISIFGLSGCANDYYAREVDILAEENNQLRHNLYQMEVVEYNNRQRIGALEREIEEMRVQEYSHTRTKTNESGISEESSFQIPLGGI